jgi:hypothetical protein
MTIKMDGSHQVIAVERFMSMQGDGQVILKIQNLHMTKQNTSCGSLTTSQEAKAELINFYFL